MNSKVRSVFTVQAQLALPDIYICWDERRVEHAIARRAASPRRKW